MGHKSLQSLFAFTLIAGIFLLAVGCNNKSMETENIEHGSGVGPGPSPEDAANNTNNPNNPNNNIPNAPAPNIPFNNKGSISLTPDKTSVASDLVSQTSFIVTVASINGFAGTVDLKATSTSISGLDSRNAITYTVVPSALGLQAGGSAQAVVTVKIGSLAPSFTNQQLQIDSLLSGSQMKLSDVKVNVTVRPVVRIRITGTTDAKWMLNNAPINTYFLANTRQVPFISHATGLSVIFENLDTVSRIVHSSGAIPHQNTAAPMAPTVGTYTPTAITPTARSQASFYLHNGENGQAGRTFLFNTDK